MSNIDILITISKVISILLILTVFNFIMYQYLTIDKDILNTNVATTVVEKFNQDTGVIDYNNESKYKPYNIRLMYENTGEYPWNRHSINSSIPYDVNIKREAVNVYYYEFDNETFNDKLKQVLKAIAKNSLSPLKEANGIRGEILRYCEILPRKTS